MRTFRRLGLRFRTALGIALGLLGGLAVPTTAPAALPTGLVFVPVPPCRVVDTRLVTAPFKLAPGSQYVFQFRGAQSFNASNGGLNQGGTTSASGCGIPGAVSGLNVATALAVNIVVVAPNGAGDLRAFASDTPLPLPTASVINYATTTIANGVIVPTCGSNVGTSCGNGDVVFQADVSGGYLVVDVAGYFTTADHLSGGGNAASAQPYRQFSPLGQGMGQPQVLDLTAVNGGLEGFQGGFTDGRYGYFVPSYNSSASGIVARVDLQNFTASGVTSLDLATVDAGLNTFQGGFTDGRYGYFVPAAGGSGKVARVDLQNFTTAGVTPLDLTTVDSRLAGFRGGFTDGRYGYLVPNNPGGSFSGKVARVDLQNFSSAGVSVLDLATVDAGLTGFAGGFTDGRYGYFVPAWGNSGASGKVARVDLEDFTTTGVTTLDLASVDPGLKGFFGGFTDGRYGYFVPNYSSAYSGKVARVDLQNFTTTGVVFLDLAAVDAGLKGFWGGFTDGRYGYFVPNVDTLSWSGKVARVDLQNFTVGGVTSLDLTTVDADLAGFGGGFTDNRYGYFVPNNNGTLSGKVARILLAPGNGSP